MSTLKSDRILRLQAEVITKKENLPIATEKNKVDFYYWHFGTLAMFQMGGKYWKKWNQPLVNAISSLQRLEDKDSAVFGSWDTKCVWQPWKMCYREKSGTIQTSSDAKANDKRI